MGVPSGLQPQSITRVRPATSTDSYGNQTLDYGSAATRKTMVGWLQQNARTEPLSNGRDPLEQSWALITNDEDVKGRDRIEWTAPNSEDVVFEVDGPPGPFFTPSGFHHLEATLKVVAG